MCMEASEETNQYDLGPEIIQREVEEAIKHTKNKKAEGVDGIPAELLKALGPQAIKKLVELCKDIYNTGVWPEDFCKTIMIPIKKKPHAKEC